MSTMTIMLITVVILALAFDFINGFHDTANSIATCVSTRVMSPRNAILMAAGLNFLGALVSQGVAMTIAKGLVVPGVKLEQYVIISALIAAIIWNLVTWYFGIPSSSSHALIGGLVGATIVFSSIHDVAWFGVLDKVIIPLFSSPIIGFLFGLLIMKLLFKILAKTSQQSVNKWFAKLQIFSAAFMAFSHGNNDAQKSMGIITLALISGGVIESTASVPVEVKIACAIVMALGTSVGGWKIIKTMGVNMIRLQPVGGFAAETGAAIVIQIASFMHAPVSTTHIISSSIMGVGSAKRATAVRWSLAKSIISAWFLTIPTTAIIGGIVTYLFKLFM